jgi:methylamine dehydrogenase accessory protein MauD
MWLVVLSLAFLLLGSLRAIGLLRWRLEQLEATTPRRIRRGGLNVGKRAPDFTLTNIAGGELALHDFAGRKVLLVFMQPGCGPCHRVTPELNRLHDAREVNVLVVQNGDLATVRKWAAQERPRFPVAVQDHYALSKQYEIFATPFAFFIDERGIIVSRGIASSRQYLGYILNKAGQEEKARDAEEEASQGPALANDSSVSSPNSHVKEVHHV